MKQFKIHSADNAPSPVDTLLTGVEKQLGFVPNVFGIIAESSPALKAFIELNGQFNASSFNATSREIIQIAVSVENHCTYCVAGHSKFAQMQKVPGDIVEAVRSNQPIADSKLEALHQFTRTLINTRGVIPESEVQKFFDAGYTQAQVIDVILGICVKTFSNLANNIIGIPLDDEFSEYAWHPGTLDKAA